MNHKWLPELWRVLRKVREEWEIHVVVLISLFLQILLLFGGGTRKRNVSRWRPFFLWTAYLLADYVAVYALGTLSRNQKLCSGSYADEMNLLVFWAPFLLLHLGGQDTITAFAVEDNELWLRHLVGLVSQAFLAAYVYSKSHPSSMVLMRPAVIMFVAGFVKYGERILALWAASMGSLRSSMLTEPDPGPSYAKFVEECQTRQYAGLAAEIVTVEEKPREDDIQVDVKRIGYHEVIYSAHKFFEIFRRLFVDLILSFHDRTDSLAFFRKLEMDQAFKVVEIELMLMYEALHSKALVIHNPIGRGLRVFTFLAPIASICLFRWGEKRVFPHPDKRSIRLEVEIIISYVLLGGAILLEVYATLLMIVSPWAYVCLRARATGKFKFIPKLLFGAIKFFQPEERPTWSNKMAQYNVISYCLQDKSRWHIRFMERLEWRWNFRVKTAWDSYWYTGHIDVSLLLKRLVFNQLKSKAISTMDPKSYRKLGEHRGQWALQRMGLYQQLGWSVDGELDESIMLWHIATDLCFYRGHSADEKIKQCCDYCRCYWFECFPPCCCSCSDYKGPSPSDNNSQCGGPVLSDLTMARMSREISNYMMYVLVMLPFMMPAGIGQIRFGDTCAEAKDFFRRGDQLPNENRCASMLAAVDTSFAEPRAVKGDRSKSVLFQACKLAKELESLEKEENHKGWKLIANVWVEMLCYAAGKCKGAVHAKQLSQGGELLTVVWLLMAHFGVGDQYRIETGHGRTKLVVDA